MRVLVTGASGQVGGAFVKQADCETLIPDRDALNLTDAGSIRAFMASHQVDAVVNCAAYTAVDKAENEPALAHAINAIAPGILAEEAARQGVPILQVSTDYVFDGKKSGGYLEEDQTAPLGIYGASKLAGEGAVRSANAQHAILRTAWVLSAEGANFLNTMIRLGGERDELGVVNDQLGCPTSATDIAHALHLMLLTKRPGTWHFVNDGPATWHDLAGFIFAEMAKRGLSTPHLNAIFTDQYPTPAKRPANSVLNTSKFQSDFGYKPRYWQDAVREILQVRLAGN